MLVRWIAAIGLSLKLWNMAEKIWSWLKNWWVIFC